MLTGVRSETFQNLLLNAGVFLNNFDYSTYKTATELITAIKAKIAADDGILGATRGGGTFQATPTVRHIEADGKRYEFKGSTINDGWTIQMTGTLLEVTPENFAIVLAMADVSTDGNIKTVVLHTDVMDDDYLEHLVWVGDTSKGVALIDLKNALNTAGANMTFTDKGEATLPFTFVAHQDKVEDYDEAPVKILYFYDASAAAASVAADEAQEAPAAYDGDMTEPEAESEAQTEPATEGEPGADE